MIEAYIENGKTTYKIIRIHLLLAVQSVLTYTGKETVTQS